MTALCTTTVLVKKTVEEMRTVYALDRRVAEAEVSAALRNKQPATYFVFASKLVAEWVITDTTISRRVGDTYYVAIK